MTLIEAIRSGKKFKRLGGLNIYWTAKDIQGHNNLVVADPANPLVPRILMRVDPLIATDWEIVIVPDNVIEFKPRGTS